MRRQRILMDCDGPLTEGFVALACDYIREESNGEIDANPVEVDQWDLMKALKVPPEIEKRVYARLEQSGTAFGFMPNAGSVEFMEELQAEADVYVVTSPLGGPHWQHDRERWLEKWYKVPDRRVCSVKDKFIVVGDKIVDDKASHLVEWSAAHPTGKAILWRVGSNRHDRWEHEASNYTQLLQLLRS